MIQIFVVVAVVLGIASVLAISKVYIGGVDTVSLRKNQLAKLRNETLGFIFQFHYLLPEFTTLENIMMPFFIQKKQGKKEMRKRAEELIEMVGLEKVKHNLAGEMSGGQQQRAAIARALFNQPQVILADEPTGNLDSETTDRIYKLLKDINDEMQSTLIVITHDKKIAEKTNRIIELKDGEIYLDLENPGQI